MKTIELRVVVRLQDNGDGGYTAHFYNNEEELLADHPMARKWDASMKEFVPVELTEEQRKEILEEHDPYGNGYISRDTVKLLVSETGITLAEPFRMHAGQ